MTEKAKCPTSTDALVQALTAAVSSIGTGGRLAEAEFGRYAATDAGWHWKLSVTREYASDDKLRYDREDTLERRIRLILVQWQKDQARHEADGQDQEKCLERLAELEPEAGAR
jgi:hypothetical protein